jgi:hypothetical protein
MGVTRLPNGVGNHPDNHPLANLPLLDPAVSHTFFEDFDRFTAADWTITGVGAGTQALQSGEGGLLRLVTAGADNDSEFLANSILSYTIAQGSFDVAFGCSFETPDEVQVDLTFGLADPGGLLPADGIVFQKDDGADLIDILVRSGSATVASALAIGTLSPNVRTALEYFYNARTNILTFGVNGVGAGQIDLDGVTLPVGLLAPSFGIQTGEVAAKTLDTDYILASRLRILNPRAV